ncbi:hypothetical protein llap_21940 [Limosa lapponica baueri]|uniref:Uncharacterized protein n=1 Tax=Limosa lapponica baueri TaxID=1758121 RepID=A0A2I0T1S3_LIMLA|nr:hypothetical protein llap_21940 [Limosa lapponica baueri]
MAQSFTAPFQSLPSGPTLPSTTQHLPVPPSPSQWPPVPPETFPAPPSALPVPPSPSQSIPVPPSAPFDPPIHPSAPLDPPSASQCLTQYHQFGHGLVVALQVLGGGDGADVDAAVTPGRRAQAQLRPWVTR